MTRFHVVIPVHNRVRKTLNVLECLQKQTFQNFTVYLVDDGSTDGTADCVKERFGTQLDLHVLLGDGNLWWSGATHLGIEAALHEASDEDAIVMMNDDIEFSEDFLARASKALLKYPDCIIGPLVLDDTDRETIRLSGTIMKFWPLSITYRPFEGCKLSNASVLPLVYDVDFLGAKATFVPVKIVRRVGNVNSQLLPHYHSDGEYSYRAKRAGFRVLICRSLVIFHSSEMTGAFNTFSVKPTFSDFLNSLVEIRSVNNIRYKINFAWLCCPRAYFVPYLISSTVKMTIRSVALMIFGERAARLRLLANKLLAKKGTSG